MVLWAWPVWLVLLFRLQLVLYLMHLPLLQTVRQQLIRLVPVLQPVWACRLV